MLQNAAYRYALREMGHGDAKQGMNILRLPKIQTDPEFEVAECHPEDSCMESTFLHTFELWKWNQKGEEAYQAKRDAQEAAKIDGQIAAEMAQRV